MLAYNNKATIGFLIEIDQFLITTVFMWDWSHLVSINMICLRLLVHQTHNEITLHVLTLCDITPHSDKKKNSCVFLSIKMRTTLWYAIQMTMCVNCEVLYIAKRSIAKHMLQFSFVFLTCNRHCRNFTCVSSIWTFLMDTENHFIFCVSQEGALLCFTITPI